VATGVWCASPVLDVDPLTGPAEIRHFHGINTRYPGLFHCPIIGTTESFVCAVKDTGVKHEDENGHQSETRLWY